MKIFIINLQASDDRRLFMKEQLNQLGLEHEFCEAVDGRKLTEKDFEVMCDMKKVKEWPDLFTPGMIGCTLSHYKVYKHMVERAVPYALILEDDTKLSPDIAGVLSNVEDMLNSGKLSLDEPVLLYYQNTKPVRFSTDSQVRIGAKYSVNYPINIWEPITTAAYIVTHQCAKRLIDLIYPVQFPSDSWGVFHREKVITGLRCVLPLPVESGYFKSDIGYELNKPLNNLIKKLESHNVFPVKQLLRIRRRARAKKLNQYILTDSAREW
jgi:glycosyl transferase, family 25